MPWPAHREFGYPLHFLAQIDLSELPATPLPGMPPEMRLPPKGMLYFFADISEEMLWGEDTGENEPKNSRVLFTHEAGPTRASPPDLPLIGGTYGKGISVFPEANLIAHAIDSFWGASKSFPDAFSQAADLETIASIQRAVGQLPLVTSNEVDVDWMALGKHSAAFFQRVYSTGTKDEKEPVVVRHQMLGAPASVQNAADIARESGDLLLLQIDTDQAVHEDFKFCDLGMVQFWIHPTDLEHGLFARAWATTEG
jgi:uncharacterized protein YwqG